MPSSSPAHNRIVALLCLCGAVLFWGVSFMATKTALSGFSPMTVVWLRMVIACFAIAPFLHLLPRPDYRPGDAKWLVLVCLLQPGVYYLAENYAIGMTTSSQAGVISAIVPLLVALGAWIFLHEHISAKIIGGIVLSMAGVVLLSVGATAAASAPNPVLGNALEVVAMASAAVATIALKHLISRYNAWLLTAIQCFAGAVLFLPGALLSHPSTWLAAPATAWWSVAYLGVFVSLGAFGLFNTAMAGMPASRAAIAINAVPLVALVTGWLVLSEGLTGLQLAGCVAIAMGVALGQSGGATPEIETAMGEG